MRAVEKIKGAFSLLLLFGEGAGAFSGGRKQSLLSFLIPLGLFPLNLWFGLLYPPRGTQEGYGQGFILKTVAMGHVLSFVFTFTLVLLAAFMFRRLHVLWRFYEAANWTALAAFIATLPFAILVASGGMGRDEMDRLFIIIGAYLYIVTGCIANRTFDLNWQLAGFIACLAVIGDQEAWRLVYHIQGIPYPWDY